MATWRCRRSGRQRHTTGATTRGRSLATRSTATPATYSLIQNPTGQWLRVDLGAAHFIGGYQVEWINSSWYSSDYYIESSTDDSTWVERHHATGRPTRGPAGRQPSTGLVRRLATGGFETSRRPARAWGRRRSRCTRAWTRGPRRSLAEVPHERAVPARRIEQQRHRHPAVRDRGWRGATVCGGPESSPHDVSRRGQPAERLGRPLDYR